MFVLDRIKMLRVTEECFQPPKDFDLAAFMKHSFNVMHEELQEVKVRISPSWARWVGEKIWHESQRAERAPDGSLILTFQVAGLEEIKRRVLSLGPEAQVLHPRELRQILRDELTRTAASYGLTLGPLAEVPVGESLFREQ